MNSHGMYRFSSLLVWLTFVSFTSQAQTDSLLQTLDTVTGDRKVKALNELFRAHIQSDPVKAIGYTREALNLATEIGDKKGMAASYNNLGVVYRNQGALDKALEYYITSMKKYEELDNKEGIATTKNNIANLYSVKKDYAQAMKYLEESYNLFIQLGDQNKIVGSLNNLGNLYSDLQLFEKATRYFSEAYQLSEKMGTPYGDPINNLGNIYYKQGNYQRAIEHYMKGMDIERNNNNRLGMLNTLTNIGIAYTQANQPKPALEYLNQAEMLARELQAYSFLPAILKNNSENLFKQNKIKDAYLTLLEYDSIREKIYGEQSSSNIAKMEMAMDLHEKEKEFEILKKEDEIKSLELRNSRLFIVLSILGLLLILASVNFYFIGKRKRIFNS
jgi:tetratricopeptide (TPR) repeat protein